MNVTREQHAAAKRLRALPGRFKVGTDAEGWPIIPGRTGQIEEHDADTLAVYTDRPRLFAKILAVPGVRRHQTGDTEARMVFPPEALPLVAQVIGAKRRRALSPAAARDLGARTAYTATRARQDRRARPVAPALPRRRGTPWPRPAPAP